MKTTQVIIGLGSSEGDKKKFLESACTEMKKLGKNFRVSSFIQSEPLGGVAKNFFLNAVASFETTLLPFELLQKLQKIEDKYQRVREVRWADRTLDLDILYYGEEKINTPELIIPHPRITERDFVMIPLLELFPEKKLFPFFSIL